MAGTDVLAVIEWFDRHRRDLPWRREPRDPWAVLVSEVMLQQTPVSRVLPAYRAWLERWPGPDELAAAPSGEAVRQWGRLGYPRRAIRLHAAAVAVVSRFGGTMPQDYDQLRSLPGVGDYTASAVLAFAHRRRVPVLDTNVRRVLVRAGRGLAAPSGSSPSRLERAMAVAVLPEEPESAAHASEALMELGALVCRSRNPECDACPLQESCLWWALGRPDHGLPAGRQPGYAGSDRQARGAIMAVLRDAAGPVDQGTIDDAWPDPVQRRRAQESLRVDGLLEVKGELVTLPL
ncbi:MAG: A/G-specific adenine glycosylase [Candidatus Nanopelagicales bacterium]